MAPSERAEAHVPVTPASTEGTVTATHRARWAVFSGPWTRSADVVLHVLIAPP